MPPPISEYVRAYLRICRNNVRLATFWSHVLVEKIRNPDSRAAEKQELSELKDTERTKGPASESRIGLVFILEALDSYCEYIQSGLVEQVGQAPGYLKAGWWGADALFRLSVVEVDLADGAGEDVREDGMLGPQTKSERAAWYWKRGAASASQPWSRGTSSRCHLAAVCVQASSTDGLAAGASRLGGACT